VATRVVPSQLDDILLLKFESDDGYARLTRDVLTELTRQMEWLKHAPELRGAVIAGSDRAFAVGADIAEVAELTASDAVEFSRYGQSMMSLISSNDKPVVAAIRGYCLGGALDRPQPRARYADHRASARRTRGPRVRSGASNRSGAGTTSRGSSIAAPLEPRRKMTGQDSNSQRAPPMTIPTSP